MIYIVIAVVALMVVWLIAEYNFFVTAKARVKAAVQEIGSQLKRQADLIPNLVSSAKGYLKHEKGIFEKLTDARKAVSGALNSGDAQKMSAAGSRLAQILPSLQVAVEDNPELKGSEVVTGLMSELRDTADKLMYARRLVIDLTADYNIKRVRFPTSMLANIFGFSELPGIITPESGEHLEVSPGEMKSQKVDL